jgi:hypothetical protein
VSIAGKILLSLVITAIWLPGWFVLSYFVVGGLAFGKFELSTEYELPIMGLMLIAALLSLALFLDFVLRKVSH